MQSMMSIKDEQLKEMKQKNNSLIDERKEYEMANKELKESKQQWKLEMNRVCFII